MGFYSLPMEKNNVKISDEYCYLVLVKYPENHFKPQNGKKLTALETKDKKEKLLAQHETMKQLETGYCNLHNQKIELNSIFDSSSMSYFRDYNEDNVVIYKIKPLASYEKSRGYDSRKFYEVSEFNVIKKFQDKSDVIDQIHKDKLLPEFSAVMFDSLSYSNEGYNLKLFDYFQYINNAFDDLEISLSDIVLSKDYKHPTRSHFRKNDTYNITKQNIRYLLDNKLIKYFKEGDYYQVELIVGLVDCGLFDIALSCIKLLEDYYMQQLLKDKTFDVVLRKWSTDETVKEIISTLGIKLSGLTLTVKQYGEYGDDKIVEVKNFDNIGEVKTHLIKEYDVPFDKVMGEDIDGLQIKNYEFSVS